MNPARSARLCSILVAAAWEPELERFRALARDGGAVTDDPCAAEPASGACDLAVEPIGIGVVDAAAGAARSIARLGPSTVVLLGTCGAAPSSGLRIGDVVVGTSARLVDLAVVEGRAAMPTASAAVPLDPSMIAALVAAGAREATIANTLGVTTDDVLAAKLAELGQVEHLEAYGVARACQTAPTPVRCAVVLGVANVVGARGRDEWRSNHVAASARAAEIAWAAMARTSTTRRSPG